MVKAKSNKVKKHKEIERRWLITDLDLKRVLSAPSKMIEQAYLDGASDVRIRITDANEAEYTRKIGRGKVRDELNMETPVEPARFLMDSTHLRLTKRRYALDGWTVDIFQGHLQGIVLAEFESKSKKAVDAAVPPAWIRASVEVTETLNNRQLAGIAANMTDGENIGASDLLRRKPRIVVTGGPCSGKSSLMRELGGSSGFNLVLGGLQCIPEVATIVIDQVGAKPPLDHAPSNRQYQRNIYRIQRAFEEVSGLHARRAGMRGIILDRGTLDGAAYMKGGLAEFEAAVRTTVAEELSRYDAVIILMPVPREIYERNKSNNKARHETYEQALTLHSRIVDAWRGHRNIILVDGATWEEKAANASRAIADILNRGR